MLKISYITKGLSLAPLQMCQTSQIIYFFYIFFHLNGLAAALLPSVTLFCLSFPLLATNNPVYLCWPFFSPFLSFFFLFFRTYQPFLRPFHVKTRRFSHSAIEGLYTDKMLVDRAHIPAGLPCVKKYSGWILIINIFGRTLFLIVFYNATEFWG
jgi:hypothetical protein